MPPSPIPAPLPPWARFLLQALPFIQAGLQEVLQYIGEAHTSGSAAPSSWMRYAYQFQDPNDVDVADHAVTTFDIVNITNGAIDSTWTESDFQTVDQQLDALVTAWMSNVLSTRRCFRCAVYRMTFSDLPTAPIPPGEHDKPFVKSGPPVRDRALTIVGTSGSGGPMPAQVSITSTERTPYAKHWGRNYWPYPTSSTVAADGHVSSAVCSALATALEQHYGSLQVSEFFPVVPVTQINKAPARGLLGVNGIQVDNVFDVIRRRRLHHRTYLAETQGAGVHARGVPSGP